MRAFEILDEEREQARLVVDDDSQRPFTFRQLHDIKARKRQQQADLARQLPLLAAMYGNDESKSEARQRKAEANAAAGELDARKRELEALRKQIAVEINAAEIDQEAKDRITQGALRAIQRMKKA